MSKSYRDHSRGNYIADKPTEENVKLGSLQRIADAAEAMAKTHIELQRNRDYEKDRADRWMQYCEAEERKNRALRGHITRLKKQIEALKSQQFFKQ